MKTSKPSLLLCGLAGLTVVLAACQAQNPQPQAPAASADPIPPAEIRTAPKAKFSPWTSEILKLSQAGIEEEIVRSFVDVAGTFNLSAEQIIQLRDCGVSGAIITAMLQHDADVTSGVRPLVITTEPAPSAFFGKSFLAGTLPWNDRGGQASPRSLDARKETERPAESPDHEPQLDTAPVVETSAAIGKLPTVAGASGSDTSQTSLPAPRPLGRLTKHYPMPETAPVELTAPILVYRGVGRVPNTIIIELFPESPR